MSDRDVVSDRKWAAGLLSQQCWCWGQDVACPDGNWLIQNGFHKRSPPRDRKNCSSVYTLELSPSCRIVLRGFGVYIGDDSIGGLFIERFGFTPKYTPLSNLECPPWSNDDLPEFADPPPKRQYDCVSLLLRLLDWIRGYESRVATTLGLGYRRQTLVQWNNGERLFIPAEQLASSWRRLSQTVAANAHTWIPIRSEPESDLLMQMKPDDE